MCVHVCMGGCPRSDVYIRSNQIGFLTGRDVEVCPYAWAYVDVDEFNMFISTRDMFAPVNG